MAHSVPALYREWRKLKNIAERLDVRWRSLLARARPDTDAAHARKRAADRAVDAAAKKLANACLDSRGRWRWDGERAPIDLLRGRK